MGQGYSHLSEEERHPDSICKCNARPWVACPRHYLAEFAIPTSLGVSRPRAFMGVSLISSTMACRSAPQEPRKAREYQCPGCGRTIPRDYGSAVNIAGKGCRYLGHKHVAPAPPKGRPTRKRPKLTRKRHSGVDHDPSSGTGKGPASFHPQGLPGVATATIRNKRKQTTTVTLRASVAMQLWQEPQLPHSE